MSLHMYRRLLRAGSAFPDYNVREYILRRTKQDFRSNRALSGPALAAALQHAAAQLAIIQRQSVIAGFYHGEPSVMDTLAATATATRKGRPAAGGVSSAASSEGGATPAEEM